MPPHSAQHLVGAVHRVGGVEHLAALERCLEHLRPADRLDLYREHRPELLAEPSPATDYQETVATTWELSFNKVKEESPAGADLLNLCAFLAPENIPLELIAGGAEYLPGRLAAAAANPLKLDKAVAALRRYSLVEKADKTLTMHRLVQAVVRERLTRKAQKTLAGAALILVNAAFPYEEEAPATWFVSEVLLPHGAAAAGHAGELEVAPEEAGRLLNSMGMFLRKRAGAGS